MIILIKMDEKINEFENIKSNYILNNIFSFLEKMRTLNVIKYNKSMLNKLKITIEDYKKTSGKYIVGDRNGKAKEFILGQIF